MPAVVTDVVAAHLARFRARKFGLVFTNTYGDQSSLGSKAHSSSGAAIGAEGASIGSSVGTTMSGMVAEDAGSATGGRNSIHVVSASSLLYRIARVVGDVTAIRKGRYPQRLARRTAYRQSGRLTRRLLRRVGL